jgi:diguanylate cyclase (GGDEF)-like protein
VISRFRVREGLEDEVRDAFESRPRLVEKAAGFRGYDILVDADDPTVFLLLTRWSDEESFRAWERGATHLQSHKMIPKELKLDASLTSVTVGTSIQGRANVQTMNAAIGSRSLELSHWLMESDAVLAFLLGSDGTIRERNRASHRMFPASPVQGFGGKIWDYLTCSDALRLQQRLADTGEPQGVRSALSMTDAKRNAITLETGVIRLDGAVLLLGMEENRHDAQFRSEILKLTNDLLVTMRDSARKNRELRQANETIDRLGRTDALTGLANRRALTEGLAREIARAERRGGQLSVIVLDLDGFKAINDEYGHFMGDRVLESVGAVVGSQLRLYDVAARSGGDEFVLLLSGTTMEEALAIAERIRHEIARIKVPGLPNPISMSLGVARWISDEGPERLISRADKALYEARNAGRNCITLAPMGEA